MIFRDMRLWLAFLIAFPLPAAVTIGNTPLPAATVGTFYAVGFSFSGGVAPYTWSSTGNVPPGLVINSGGSITGTPTVAGSYSFTLTVVDGLNSTANRPVTLLVKAAALSVTTSQLPAGLVGQSYTASLTATGGTPPYRWTAGGGMPAGLTLDSQTGKVSGTPIASGIFSFDVQVTDGAQTVASASISVRIEGQPLTITTAPPLFTGTIGIAYSQAFSGAGGKPPYVWSIIGGNAGGLTLDASTGTLRGTPQTAGTFNFVIQVADAAGATSSKNFSVVVTPPVLSIAVSAALPGGAVGTTYSQKLPAAATGGVPPYRWSLPSGASVAPGLDLLPDTLTIFGTPIAAGAFTFTVQVTDASQQTATKALTIIIAPASLTITTSLQLPDGALNVRYTSSVVAVGGAPPYTWSAAGLPAGLSIDASTGALTGIPSAAGNFPIAITVADSTLNHVSDRFTLNINLPPAPAVIVSGLPDVAEPAGQYPIQIALASSFPAPVTGQAILTFAPESGATDKTVQFASGGTVASFSIPAGATGAISAIPLAIQTGTVAGTIEVSIRLQAGGLDITPVSAPAISTRIGRAAPVITDVRMTRSDGKIELSVSGYSTAREVTQATFVFTAAAGSTLQATASSVPVAVESIFSAWFQDPANGSYGSQFVFKQPFNVQGDSQAVSPASVTLTNRTGSTTYQVK